MQTREILRIKGDALFTLPPEAGLPQAIAIMAEHDMGSVVIMERGRLQGMLTFREVLRALQAAPGGIQALSVSQIMARDPLTVGPDMEVGDLSRRMLDSHARYVPVIDGQELLGVLSFHDVAKAILEEQSFENSMLRSYIKNWPED
jgi:CBS domain-containing protein